MTNNEIFLFEKTEKEFGADTDCNSLAASVQPAAHYRGVPGGGVFRLLFLLLA